MTVPLDSLPVEIQPRDIELLRGLFESRMMTLAHAAAIYFAGSREAAKKRVQKLKAAGLIRERTRKAYQPSILYLTKAGWTVLVQGGHLADFPRLTWEKLENRLQVSELTLRHELSVLDVKAAFHSAVRAQLNLKIAEFTTWPKLSEFNAFHPATGAKVIVRPDGFIRLQETEADGERNEQLFFLEVDRSTEVLEVLTARAHCYLNYQKRGGLAVRLGGKAEDFKEFSFRVLIVCKTAERRNNLALNLIQDNPPIKSFAWLTTMAEMVSDPLGAIWVQPKDYMDAVKVMTNTAMEANRRFGYRRQSEREALIERGVHKQRLIE